MFGNRERTKKRTAKRSSVPHDDFLELCAVSTTGELSEQERVTLREHLAGCSKCRQALTEFEAAARVGAPLVASELATPELSGKVLLPTETRDIPSPEEADRLTENADDRELQKELVLAHLSNYHTWSLNSKHIWMPFAAAVTLIVALGIYMYQTGKRRGVEVAQAMPSAVNSQAQVDVLEQKLSDTGHQREVLQARLTERDRLIRQLRQQMQTQSAELAEARNTAEGLGRSLQADQAEKLRTAQERTALSQQLDAAETSLKKSQEQLVSLRQARERDELRAGSLSDQIKDLTGQLTDREQVVDQQQEMLSEDRDIRDLMGARNLYIAEVYDVARDGTTRKPYGRVFYTRGKSLIFYAYDLDQQLGVKKTNAFQAWGLDSTDRQRALNLGIFYQDSASQKRWVLKFDNPRKLDQINAVFVTVEPHGGSEEPSGKRLLFASLRIEPNHP